MTESDTKITLIGSRLAREGLEFIFKGEMPECKKCRLKNTCLNLEPGAGIKLLELKARIYTNVSCTTAGFLRWMSAGLPSQQVWSPEKQFKGQKLCMSPPNVARESVLSMRHATLKGL